MSETYSEMTRIIPLLNDSKAAKTLMEALPRIIQFELDGEQKKFFITIKQGQMSISQGISKRANIVVSGDTSEFAKVVAGKIDITHLIARGQITVEKGKVSEMTLLNRILWSNIRR